MFPGESPGRSRLALLGRRSAFGGSSELADCGHATKVNHFYNGRAHQQFHDTMNDAVSGGRITLGQYAELAEAGLIVRGSNRRHAVFEVSLNPDNDDITRALERAEILRQATGDTVTAAVITHQPNPEFAREAETKGVKVLDLAP